MTTRRAQDDAGFTLVELLVTILLMGVIAVPLGGALWGYLRNQTSTTARLDESHDLQLAAAYWAQDVASIGTRSTTDQSLLQSVDDTGSAGWSYPCTVAGATPVVRFAWDDYSWDPVAKKYVNQVVRVAYVRLTGTNGENQLLRLQCVGSPNPTSMAVMAHDVNASIPPSVACLTASGSTSCTGLADNVPVRITLTIHIRDAKDADADPLAHDLVGVRRQT